jgi:hypothetical protein
MTILGYYILKDCEFMPPSLFGTGDLDNWFMQLPTWPKPWGFEIFFLCSIGFFLEDIVELICREKKKDFNEMFLHHLISAALIFFSYIINCDSIGCVIVWLHYISDICISFTRATMEMKGDIVPGIAVGLTILSWAYTRLYVFLFVIWSCTKINFKTAQVGFSNLASVTHCFFIAFLSILYILHWYWFLQILKITSAFLQGKGK